MSKLPNYLRSHRKSLALSQRDVAFLLGIRGATKLCRLERFIRAPAFEEALALAVILKKPVEEIFVGIYHKVELEIASRARALGYQLDRKNCPQQSKRRRDALKALATLSKVKR